MIIMYNFSIFSEQPVLRLKCEKIFKENINMKRMKKVLSLLLALIMTLSLMLTSLTSCDFGSQGGEQGEEQEGEGGGEQGGGSQENPYKGNTVYTVGIKTAGGMKYSDLAVYLYSYENGKVNKFLEYGVTNADGKVSFSLDETKEYAVRIDSSLPEGYDCEEYYPLTGTDTSITVSSSLITDGKLSSAKFELGDIMYDFTVTTVDGTPFTLSEALETYDMVLINFWYTACSWCLEEFPVMNSVYQQYSDKVAIIAIDPIDLASDAEMFYKTFDTDSTTDEIETLSFEVGTDNNGELALAFGVESYPTSVVIDRYGMISLIEPGAIISEKPFTVIFDHFTGENYNQKIINTVDDIIERTLPTVEMPSSEEIGAALESGDLNLSYKNDEKDEYSWPFVVGEKDGETCIVSTNTKEDDSYSQLITSIDLKEGDVVAFDYYASTELGCDILYFVVDGKNMYSISGLGTEWEECYSYVAPEDGTYDIAFIYIKDDDTYEGEDKVYIKNLRVVSVDEVTSPSYIYRFAATKPDKMGYYQQFITPVYNENDGYYHVGTTDGPLLLADLMGYTRFSNEENVYSMSIGEPCEQGMLQYANYSVNSQLYGLCPVTEVLKGYLVEIAAANGGITDTAWLEFCCYYDAYGTDGEELADPIAGLAPFSAYETILSQSGSNEFPNVVTYDRLIMPRGLFFKLRPEESGVYLIMSNSTSPVDGWIFKEEDFVNREAWYTYENVARGNTDETNCYMIAYLDSNTDYYINVAFRDNYEYGKIAFKVERLGDAGYYRFSLASPGYFTYHESVTGTLNKIVSDGIDVELGSDGYWREKVTEGERDGSLLYADFSKYTYIFSNRTLTEILAAGGFDFSKSEDDQTIISLIDEYVEDGKTVEEAIALTDDDLKALWADSYDSYADIYKLEEIYNAYRGNGSYHGIGPDYTQYITEYLEQNLITAENADDESKIGCVVVNAELAEALQLLMDKYTFEGVENSWRKLCYYTQYFGPDNPV